MSSYSDTVKISLKDKTEIVEKVYPVPTERFANDFSSIKVGLSEEGGLSTLTYKSIGYTRYAEQLALMREALFHSKQEEPTRITSKSFDGQSAVHQLQADIAKLRNSAPENTSKADQEVTNLNAKLTQIVSNKNSLEDVGKEIFNSYKADVPGKDFLVNPAAFTKTTINSGSIKVDDISQVQNLDITPYELQAQGQIEVHNNMVIDSGSESFTPEISQVIRSDFNGSSSDQY
ncbi:hypothetical protein PSN45_003089 [Yamadazyma tenuis]|uniref:uncharacterized protein n=1 Tax=Candida tenuis TaxID=2315449 RepID=UPI0027AAF0A7|nr:hypothetical protein PSN45_003089 [Yamadazyma tenuis]